MDNFSTGNVKVPEDEVISSWVEVIFDELQSINSLLVVPKGPKAELLLGVHDLDLATLITNCEDCAVRSDAYGC